MKKILLLFTLTFCLSISKAQNYNPFPTGNDSIVWNITEWSWGNPFGYFLYSQGDSLINGLSYTKYYQGDSLYNSSNPLTLLIREENKKIFTKSLTSNSESLLYDFTLNINDSISYDNQKWVLVKVDSILLENNEYRKQYYYYVTEEFVYPDTAIATEGFGNISEGFVNPIGIHYLDYGLVTTCIFTSTEVYYKNFSYINQDCYKLQKPTSIKSLLETRIKLYPNPFFNDIFFINKIRNSDISIYSSKGEMLFQKNNFTGNSINIPNIKKGIYFLQVEGKINGFQKIIKL